MSGCGQSLFGAGSQYIKVGNGEFVAISGAVTAERMGVSELRMPYKQLLKGRIILKAGQVNYLLNHLGLGDNATFLAIKATYANGSVIEADNYINWSFYDDLTKMYSFAQMMVLTGNSTNRIKQMYLTNTNTKYDITLEVMVGVIDDQYSFFSDTLNQSGTLFTDLQYTDIQSYIVGESILMVDINENPLVYIRLSNIQSIEKTGNILILDDTSFGRIFFQFATEFDVNQANSLLNYLISNNSIDTSLLYPLEDLISPVVYFYENIGVTGSYISFNGATGSAFDTSYGYTFSTSISISDYGTTSGTHSIINANQLIHLMIDTVVDNRDGTMSMDASNLIITSDYGIINSITMSGTYSLTFDLVDIAQNNLEDIIITLNILN